MPRNNANRGKAEGAAVRRLKALDLRVEGMSYRRIADRLNVSFKTAYDDVQDALADLAALEGRKAEDLRRLELQRCDMLWARLLPRIKKGEPAAVTAAIKVMERRAKLQGIDRAGDTLKVNVSGNMATEVKADGLFAEIDRRAAALAALRGRGLDGRPALGDGGRKPVDTTPAE